MNEGRKKKPGMKQNQLHFHQKKDFHIDVTLVLKKKKNYQTNLAPNRVTQFLTESLAVIRAGKSFLAHS